VKITRYFHPIGQGGFTSEHHEFGHNKFFTIVYDCGVAHNRRSADSVVRHPVLKGRDIDILFISHFDYDHVCKLKVLASHVGKIKNVVMPLLHKQEQIILTNLYRLSGFNILTLINAPEKYFGNGTKVFRVAPGTRPDGEYDGPVDGDPVSLDTLPSSVPLRSGVRISLPLNTAPLGHDWIFIPYNHEYSAHSHLLQTELDIQGFNIELLRTDPTYTLRQAINRRDILKKIYNKLPGGINQNSMLVYSGPEHHSSPLTLKHNLQGYDICSLPTLNSHIETFSRAFAIWSDYDLNELTMYYLADIFCGYFEQSFYAPGCIYTGDINLNHIDIHNVFKQVWRQVSTLQIPHHGARPCFNTSLLDHKRLICPIAVGSNFYLSYGHPAISVINSIIQMKGIPVFVTERNPAFIQVIA